MYANTYIHVYTYIYIVNVGFMFIPCPLWLHPCAHSSLAGRPPFAAVGGRGQHLELRGKKEQ